VDRSVERVAELYFYVVFLHSVAVGFFKHDNAIQFNLGDTVKKFTTALTSMRD